MTAPPHLPASEDALRRWRLILGRYAARPMGGVGMQGDGWNRMTTLHLYHIVSALNRVGLSAEARMIAAEAVARARDDRHPAVEPHRHRSAPCDSFARP